MVTEKGFPWFITIFYIFSTTFLDYYMLLFESVFLPDFYGAEVKVCALIFGRLSQVGRGLKYKYLMAMCVIFS